jgi:lauroyl/myristoyl acyltransferase
VKSFVVGALRWLGRRSVRAAVLVAHVLARLTRPLGHGISDDWLSAVFPQLDARARRAARQRTWENFLKGEAVRIAATYGRYPPLLPNPRLAALRPPLVLASFHVGPYAAIGTALARLAGEVVALDRGQFGRVPHVTVLPRGENAAARSRAFSGALSALRSGGFVFVNVDAFEPEHLDEVSTIEVPMLGRTLPLARGAFALARIAGVPIVPIVPRWRGQAIDVEIGESMRLGPDGERGLAEATAAWIERYLRERPGETSVFMLERLRPPFQDR